MVSVFALSAVDSGFEPWLGQSKDYKNLAAILSIMSGSTFKTAVILYIRAVRLDIFQGNDKANFFSLKQHPWCYG